MNKGFPLWLKFSFLGLLLLLCLLTLSRRGLKLGMDIEGGYSMVFEIHKGEKNPHRLVEQIIPILKERLDPTGLAGLSFVNQGNRFEIRVPAASKKARNRRAIYQKAEDQLLEKTEISRGDLRRLMGLAPQDRPARIKELAGPDDAQAKRLETLVSILDSLELAREKVAAVRVKIDSEKSNDPKVLRALQEELVEAEGDVKKVTSEKKTAWDELRDGIIQRSDLVALRRLYDEILARRSQSERDVAAASYRVRLDEYIKSNPAWKDDLQSLFALYKSWSDVRKPLEDPADLIRRIKKAGVLEFRIAPPRGAAPEDGGVAEATVANLVKRLLQEGPEGIQKEGGHYAWFPLRGETGGHENQIVMDRLGKRYILLSNKPGESMLRSTDRATAWSLSDARVGNTQLGRLTINFEFDEAGAIQFHDLTGSNLKEEMAILLDDEVYSAPTIQSAISSSGQITGSYTLAEARELARTLKAGSLPGKLNPDPISQSSFGAAIGDQNVKAGYRAAIIGLIAVAAFMLFYYLLAGAITNIALMLNLTLVLGAMSMFDAVLTLPGIAGVILTIGIAVDANVLIFERLREEQDRGLGIRQAIQNA